MNNNNLHVSSARKGFVLPFTMLIAAIILFITLGAMTVLSKQLYFSKLNKQSQTAYYAADSAIGCAITIDDTYISSDGLGMFPSDSNPSSDGQAYINNVLTYVNNQRTSESPPLAAIALTDIVCAKSNIFTATAPTNFRVDSVPYTYTSLSNSPELGKSSSFTMRMDTGGGNFRCAKVTVNKTQSFRQIVAQGYAECGNPNGSVERAVVNTVVVQ